MFLISFPFRISILFQCLLYILAKFNIYFLKVLKTNYEIKYFQYHVGTLKFLILLKLVPIITAVRTRTMLQSR